jgi:hypothetical protein
LKIFASNGSVALVCLLAVFSSLRISSWISISSPASIATEPDPLLGGLDNFALGPTACLTSEVDSGFEYKAA